MNIINDLINELQTNEQDARVRNGAERRESGSQEGCRHWLQHPFGSHTTVCEAGLTHLHR